MAAVKSFVERSLTGAAARYVERIWLDINNRDEVFQVLPDGCVDVVLELGTDAGQIVAYGSTTKPAITRLRVGLHYLGIRFQPGMARHFFDHSPVALTDRHIRLNGFLGLDLEQLTQGVQRGAGLLQLETALLHGLAARQPVLSPIDRAVRFVLANHGDATVAELARQSGKSVRQFERLFVTTLGLTPNAFSSILRARRAMDTIHLDQQSDLASIAAAGGYTDQSHMYKDFLRLTGRSPGSFR